MSELVFAGAGGQGVLTAGLIMSEILLAKGFNTTWMPQYGSAMRGGDADCTVKFSQNAVYNPAQEAPDIVLAMNDSSAQKLIHKIKTGGTLLINADLVERAALQRSDINILAVPCISLAQEIGFSRAANIIMTGVVARLLGVIEEEEAVSAMNRMFEEKGKGRFSEQNSKALRTGFQYKV